MTDPSIDFFQFFTCSRQVLIVCGCLTSRFRFFGFSHFTSMRARAWLSARGTDLVAAEFLDWSRAELPSLTIEQGVAATGRVSRSKVAASVVRCSQRRATPMVRDTSS